MYSRYSVRTWLHPFFEANNFEEAMYFVAFGYENSRKTTEQNFLNNGKKIIFVGTTPSVNFSSKKLVRIHAHPFFLSNQQFLGNDVGVSPNTHVLFVANCKNSKRVFEFLYISLAAFYGGSARGRGRKRRPNFRNGSENWSGSNKGAKEKWNHKPGRLFFSSQKETHFPHTAKENSPSKLLPAHFH